MIFTTADLLSTLARELLVDLGGVDRGLRRRDLGRLERLLRRAGEALAVLDLHDVRPIRPGTAIYQRAVIERALDAEARRLIGPPVGPEPDVVVRRRRETVGTLFSRGLVADRVDVNHASANALADLPGLGDVSARRLVAARRTRGLFDDLDDARRAAGVGPTAWARTAPSLFVGDGSEASARSDVDLRLDRGGARALAEAVRSGEVVVPGIDRAGPAGAVDLVERLVQSIERRRIAPRHWGPSRSRLAGGDRAMRTLARVRRRARTDDGFAALVRGSAYVEVVERMIDDAVEAIDVAMFFFAVSDDAVPAARLLHAVVRAHQRGVDVRILLEDDLPDDYHGAGSINEGAASRLAAAGVPLRRGPLDHTLHAKIVRVDSAVVVGSHNWTTSSFYRYDDTSVIALDVGVVERFGEQFERMWNAVDPDLESRRVELADLLQIPGLQRGRLIAAGVATVGDLVSRGSTVSGRRSLASIARAELVAIDRAVRSARLMSELGVAEHTALALVDAGLDTPAKVESASLADLESAVAAMTTLEEPFGRRTPPAGLAEWIWRLER